LLAAIINTTLCRKGLIFLTIRIQSGKICVNIELELTTV
jgi:hypothetical protein